MWRKMVRFSLYAEKIEDGVSDIFISFGRRISVLLRGNPHRKVLGESFTYTFSAPTIYPPFEEREVPQSPLSFAVLPMAVVPLH